MYILCALGGNADIGLKFAASIHRGERRGVGHAIPDPNRNVSDDARRGCANREVVELDALLIDRGIGGLHVCLGRVIQAHCVVIFLAADDASLK